MFKRDVQNIKDLILRNLRVQGRLVEGWTTVTGDLVARYTTNVFIRNQTLFVYMNNSALRAELSMHRQELVKRLNDHVGAQVITDISFK